MQTKGNKPVRRRTKSAPKRKVRIKVNVGEKVSLQKKDKTTVAMPDTTTIRKAPSKVPSNGAVFRIKIRKR